jgi:ribosomal protein L17
MQDLKSVYDKLQMKKRERRELVKMFQDELKHNGEYQELLKQAKLLREKKKSFETQAKANALSDARQLDSLAEDIKGSTELLTDVVIAKFFARETVELTDEENNRLVPVFAVRFRKEEGESMTEQIQAERAASHPERMFAPTAMVADTMTEKETEAA